VGNEEPNKPKAKAVAIDPTLHHYVKLLAARERVGIGEIVEKPLRLLVSANREWLEKMTGEAVRA
jgi:hypothetical protein